VSPIFRKTIGVGRGGGNGLGPCALSMNLNGTDFLPFSFRSHLTLRLPFPYWGLNLDQ